jgi:hypothetical protein
MRSISPSWSCRRASRQALDRGHRADAHLAGSHADDAQPTIFAHVELRPSARSTRSSRTTAAAPSTMPLALPAVTVPSLPNAARSFASASSVVSGLMWSSVDLVALAALLDLDRRDLLGEAASFTAFGAELVAAQRVLVLLLARDARGACREPCRRSAP